MGAYLPKTSAGRAKHDGTPKETNKNMVLAFTSAHCSMQLHPIKQLMIEFSHKYHKVFNLNSLKSQQNIAAPQLQFFMQ